METNQDNVTQALDTLLFERQHILSYWATSTWIHTTSRWFRAKKRQRAEIAAVINASSSTSRVPVAALAQAELQHVQAGLPAVAPAGAHRKRLRKRISGTLQ